VSLALLLPLPVRALRVGLIQALGVINAHRTMIAIAPYNASWPAMFESEATRIREVLGGRALRIEHVGSTSIPGLAAKPVIDIQISVQSLRV
jgi:GrpB-like predicted nucleotidyltransferase (UPF0157 family)